MTSPTCALYTLIPMPMLRHEGKLTLVSSPTLSKQKRGGRRSGEANMTGVGPGPWAHRSTRVHGQHHMQETEHSLRRHSPREARKRLIDLSNRLKTIQLGR